MAGEEAGMKSRSEQTAHYHCLTFFCRSEPSLFAIFAGHKGQYTKSSDISLLFVQNLFFA